jgi:transposase
VSERTRYLGLDAHKATIEVTVVGEQGSPEDRGQIPNDPSAVRKLVRRVGGPGVRLVAAYEAGPTGYALHRQLTALGVECIVIAPSLVPKRPGDRVKTDRRDSEKLARLLRSGDLTPVWVPDEEQEALRNLVRGRADAKVDLLRAKHRLTKFLLRHGVAAPAGVRAWTCRWESWLDALAFRHVPDQVVFEDYRAVVRAAEHRVKRLEAALVTAAEGCPQAPLIHALQALRGVAFLTAVTLVAEVGDPRRFPTARQFMAYAGLVPSEHSSGASRHRGYITKTGNSLIRHVLGESAQHCWRPPRVGRPLERRQQGVSPEVIEVAWRAQQRLHLRYRHLSGRLGRPKAVTAVARELSGFVWAISQLVEAPAAA